MLPKKGPDHPPPVPFSRRIRKAGGEKARAKSFRAMKLFPWDRRSNAMGSASFYKLQTAGGRQPETTKKTRAAKKLLWGKIILENLHK